MVPAPRRRRLVRRLAEGARVGGRYEIVRLLGEGGMGTVYQARDLELDRAVALKVIRPELATHPAVLQRFWQELILAREVTHPNVPCQRRVAAGACSEESARLHRGPTTLHTSSAISA